MFNIDRSLFFRDKLSFPAVAFVGGVVLVVVLGVRKLLNVCLRIVLYRKIRIVVHELAARFLAGYGAIDLPLLFDVVAFPKSPTRLPPPFEFSLWVE